MAKTATCPSCGAPVVFRSVASILAVCDYCQSTLVRQDGVLENLGKMAEFLSDRSRLQRGSEGVWKKRHFGIIGRLQLKYDEGLWDEWHLLFDDGRSGWLSEAGGEYVLSEPVRIDEALPAFAQLAVGEALTLGGRAFQVSNLLRAECVAGAGELPFKVGGGYPAPVVDLRASDGAFATLDYSDAEESGGRPLVFIGEPVAFSALKLSNLRDPNATAAPTVKARNFQCPNCGAPLSARSAEIQSVGCGSCGSLIDPQNVVAEEIASAFAKQKVRPLLELGTVGTLRGEKLELIGFMQRRMKADGVNYYWREYVALAPDNSLRWLSEYDGHWNLSRVLSKSVAALGEKVRFGTTEFKHFQTYDAFVDFVIGEFPWKVKLDERAKAHDYVAPPQMLSREVTTRDDTWTLSEYLPHDEVQAAFSPRKPLPSPRGVFANQPNVREQNHRRICKAFWQFFLLAWVVHIALLMFGPGEVLKESVSYRNEDDEPRLSKEFVLPEGARRLEIEHEAQVSNSWVALNLTLVNKKTGESWQVARELSYYEGVDDGESWSEGSRHDDFVFTDLPAGTYVLAEEAELDPARPSVGGQLRIAHAGPRWSSLILLTLFLMVFPIFTAFRYRAFEVERWAESDHPMVTTSSDDDD